MTAKRLFSAHEAARYLCISRAKLYELDITSFKIGSRRLFDLNDLDEWIDRLKSEQKNGKT